MDWHTYCVQEDGETGALTMLVVANSGEEALEVARQYERWQPTADVAHIFLVTDNPFSNWPERDREIALSSGPFPMFCDRCLVLDKKDNRIKYLFSA